MTQLMSLTLAATMLLFAASEEDSLMKPTTPQKATVPPIDKDAPAKFETATFALG